jgi:hypothetical protein
MTKEEAIENPLNTLQRWRYRESYDPRDKLYGLMGLFRSSDLPSIDCDYTASAAKVFIDLTLDLLHLGGDLLPLVGWRGETHMTPGLPTWALDMVRPPNEANTGWCGFWDHVPRFQTFRADDNMSLELKTTSDKSILALQGLPIDMISVIDKGIAVSNDERVQIPTADVIRTVKRREQLFSNFMSQKSSEEYIAGGHWYNAFWRTMLGDLVTKQDTEQVAVQSDRELFDEYLEHGTRNKVVLSLLSMIRNQTFFITKEGYIGIGPSNTRTGDMAWILFGGRLPFILRPIDSMLNARLTTDDYTCVGDAHVQGVMFGELLRLRRGELRHVSLH